jgi:hypothetical protein
MWTSRYLSDIKPSEVRRAWLGTSSPIWLDLVSVACLLPGRHRGRKDRPEWEILVHTQAQSTLRHHSRLIILAASHEYIYRHQSRFDDMFDNGKYLAVPNCVIILDIVIRPRLAPRSAHQTRQPFLL